MIVCQMFFAFLLLQAVLVPSVVDADHTKTCPDPEAEDYDECLCKECCVFDIMFKAWFLLAYCEDLTFGGWWTCAQHCPKGDPHGWDWDELQPTTTTCVILFILSFQIILTNKLNIAYSWIFQIWIVYLSTFLMYLSTFFNVFVKMININKLNIAYSWISCSGSCSSTLNCICLNF